MDKKFTIVFKENGISRKVMKLVLYNEGGFSFFMPYHNAKSGVLTKFKLDYLKRHQHPIIDEKVTFSSDDIVKLSYHNDGFIQFSSVGKAKIISGRDPVTQKAKGLGVISKPLNDLIKSGPTFGATFWGFNDYEVFEPKENNNDVLEFSENDYYYRHFSYDNWDGYILEGFLFKYDECKEYIKQIDEKYLLPTLHNNFEIPNTLFFHRIVPNFSQEYVISIIVSRIKTRFASPSGYCLGSASEMINKRFGYALYAMYPDINNDIVRKSLQYKNNTTDLRRTNTSFIAEVSKERKKLICELFSTIHHIVSKIITFCVKENRLIISRHTTKGTKSRNETLPADEQNANTLPGGQGG